MNKKEIFQVYELILRLAALFSFRCNVCHKKCTTGKYFTLHHINYRCSVCKKILDANMRTCTCGAPAEKIHSDFKKRNSKGNYEPDRLAYYQYLFPIVSSRPEDFALICNSDHGVVTKLVRYKKLVRKRLFKLTNQSAND